MREKLREWFRINPETLDQFDSILGEELTSAKIKTLALTNELNGDYPMIKLVATLTAANIRRVSILAPGILAADGFDLGGYHQTSFVVFIQSGNIISAYQETE